MRNALRDSNQIFDGTSVLFLEEGGSHFTYAPMWRKTGHALSFSKSCLKKFSYVSAEIGHSRLTPDSLSMTTGDMNGGGVSSSG
jgi:hypothetical protein